MLTERHRMIDTATDIIIVVAEQPHPRWPACPVRRGRAPSATRSGAGTAAERGDREQDIEMHVAVTNRDDNIALVAVRGSIDLTTAGKLRDAMHALLEAGRTRIVVDLSDVEFCDSIGLGTFAYGHHHCVAAGGFLRLAAPPDFLARLLRTVGLAGPIPVLDTVDAALHADTAAT
ncbi:STAS domain-containing protein [Dactylosporangium sp. CA-092794]|uniref:STAS domain-containing protein n=1 Tax=Dactylosporangium sp. CA-092794 TaxID=3239929 RepID=UPI003D92B5D0